MTPKRLLSKLAAFNRQEGLISPGDGVLIALSGGADSVCLAHHLARLAPRLGLRLAAVHFHHGLRGPEADRDAAFSARLAERLGIRFVLKRLDVAGAAARRRQGLEDAGRFLRYRELGLLARRLGIRKVAVGHHLDDQAETVLAHLLRGTKAKGLGGIPPRRPLREPARGTGPGVELIRPLLALSRVEVLAYLKAYRLPYRVDRSNRSERFTRNWIRRRVLPLLARRNPRVREHLAAIAKEIRDLRAVY